MMIQHMLLIFIAALLIYFCYVALSLLIRTARCISITKKEHIWIIKQACKQGKLNILINNCKQCIKDYDYWSGYQDLDKFFHREWFLCVYSASYATSHKILTYLSQNSNLKRYYKLNQKSIDKKI